MKGKLNLRCHGDFLCIDFQRMYWKKNGETVCSTCQCTLFVALLRRGVAYQGKKDWQNAKNDLENVLKREPGNKRAIVSNKAYMKRCFTNI